MLCEEGQGPRDSFSDSFSLQIQKEKKHIKHAKK